MTQLNSNPLISVIVPCYNQARFLRDSLTSLLNQTYKNWECIIVNDGSTDNTTDVAAEWCCADNRFRLINQENKGLSGARNRGIVEAKGQYIQFLDADDLILPEKFALQIESLYTEFEALSVCYSDYCRCHENNSSEYISDGALSSPRFIMQSPLDDIIMRWETEFSIPIHCFLFDARFFKENAIRFDEKLPNHEDWDCWVQIFSLNPIIKLTASTLAVYRINGSSMCVDHKKMEYGFCVAIRKQMNSFKGNADIHAKLSKKLNNTKIFYRKKRWRLYYDRYLKYNHTYAKIVPWPIQKYINSIFTA